MGQQNVDFPWVGHKAIEGLAGLDSGRRFDNAGEHSTLKAATDIEAVKAWLQSVAHRSPNTLIAFRKEAERFVLWVRHIGKTLSELTTEECLQYRSFLQNIPDQWIMDRRYRRYSTYWRPFSGRLSPKSQNYSLAVIHGLLGYLTSTGWLKLNPMPKTAHIGHSAPPGHYRQKSLSDALLKCVMDSINEQRPETRLDELYQARDRWMMVFLTAMASRVSETICSMGTIVFQYNTKGERFAVWNVTGKGNRSAELPIPDDTLAELKRFRILMGLTPEPQPNDPFPLFPSLRHMSKTGEPSKSGVPRSLCRSAIYKRLKEVIFARARVLAEERNLPPGDIALLSQASTHWLRHTSLRIIADNTKDMRLVQMAGRHSSIHMAGHYAATSMDALRDALNESSSARHVK